MKKRQRNKNAKRRRRGNSNNNSYLRKLARQANSSLKNDLGVEYANAPKIDESLRGKSKSYVKEWQREMRAIINGNGNTRISLSYGKARYSVAKKVIRLKDKINRQRSKERSRLSDIRMKNMGKDFKYSDYLKIMNGKSPSRTQNLFETNPKLGYVRSERELNRQLARLERQSDSNYISRQNEQYRANWLAALNKTYFNADPEQVTELDNFANSMSADDFFAIVEIMEHGMADIASVYTGEQIDSYLEKLTAGLTSDSL